MTLEELIKTIQVAIVEAKWNYPLKYLEEFETRNRYSKLLLSLRQALDWSDTNA